MITDLDKHFMRRAVELSLASARQGGQPFGAVVVYRDQIIGEGDGRATADYDPTAHAEVVALRQAARHLQAVDLSDCKLYTSCEPCVMCVGAIYWAKVAAVYYANTQFDARAIGADDGFLYGQLNMTYEQRSIPFRQVPDALALEAFGVG